MGERARNQGKDGLRLRAGPQQKTGLRECWIDLSLRQAQEAKALRAKKGCVVLVWS